jgi:hypothetical protein
MKTEYQKRHFNTNGRGEEIPNGETSLTYRGLGRDMWASNPAQFVTMIAIII